MILNRAQYKKALPKKLKDFSMKEGVYLDPRLVPIFDENKLFKMMVYIDHRDDTLSNIKRVLCLNSYQMKSVLTEGKRFYDALKGKKVAQLKGRHSR